MLNGKRITPLIATSLLNDFNYSNETTKNLIDVGQALFSSHADLMAKAAQEIVLDEEEIEKLSSV